MPRGGRRPGAGRKRKSLASHVLSGTFRADRHGQQVTTAAAVLTMPAPASACDWRPSEAELKVLSPLVQTWLHATLTLYRLDALEGQRLLEALRVLSRVEVLDATSGMTAAGALIRERKLFASMWAALNLRGGGVMATRRSPAEDELYPELVNVLVEGWGGPTRDDSTRSFSVFELSEDDLRDIARRHRDVLQREAHRRGLDRPFYCGASAVSSRARDIEALRATVAQLPHGSR